MAHANNEFDTRLKRINRSHGRARSGVSYVMTRDGLIVARPRRRVGRFPLQGFLMLVGAGLLFKGFLYANLGGVTYNERVNLLAEGSIVEKAGAWLMQADAATIWISEVIRQMSF